MEKIKNGFKALLGKLWSHIKEHPSFYFSVGLVAVIALLLSNFGLMLFAEVCFLLGWFRLFGGLDGYNKFTD